MEEGEKKKGKPSHRNDVLNDGFVGGHLGAVNDRHVGPHPRHEQEFLAF